MLRDRPIARLAVAVAAPSAGSSPCAAPGDPSGSAPARGGTSASDPEGSEDRWPPGLDAEERVP
jgi:hypothetical protein